jgi:hypothetical protein
MGAFLFAERSQKMAKISIRPIEPLEMEFADGTIKKALFNTEAFVIYTDEFGKFDNETIKEMQEKPYDFVAKILYCGMKVVDKSITLPEAESIVIGGGEELAVEIANLMIDNFMVSADENSKKKFMKEVAKINKQFTQ